MQLTFNRVVTPAAAGGSVSDLITRGHANEIWHVPFSPLVFTAKADWRHYKREAHVVIPLFPYLVPSQPVDALGFAFQLGVLAIQQLGGRTVRRLHLSLGNPINQVVVGEAENPMWAFHLGIGVVLE